MLTHLKNFILDMLFPIHCLYCQKYGQWICEECAGKINILEDQVCPYCEKNISPHGRICSLCKNKFLEKNENWPLDALLVSSKYNKSGISRSIYCFKYSFIESLGTPLARIITEAIIFHALPLPNLIIPIPLHHQRLRWRGFNQSEILARHIGENLTPGFSIPVIPNFLIRKKYTSPQMKIKNYQKRQKNVRGIFTLNKKFPNPEIIKNKTILLLDDVSTTGATIFEVAQVLKSAGAKKVYGAVIVRQEIHPAK